MTVFGSFSAALACLVAFLTFTGFANAYPQQSGFQQQPQNGQPTYVEPVSEVCLGCICESISSCNRNQTCEGDVCGMFRITWAYWFDSGKPVLPGDNPNDGQAFARCTNDPLCARQSVINYLTRFAQDCNRDGSIDCLDYATIHMLGGYGCGGPLNWEYKTKIDSCRKSVSELSGSPIDANQNIEFPKSTPKENSAVDLDPEMIRIG